jgi:hypothetical protein
VVWLAECIREETGGDPEEIAKSLLREAVKDEYGFRSDTAKRYVKKLVGHFGLVEHPNNSAVLVTPEQRESIIADAASSELDDLPTNTSDNE